MKKLKVWNRWIWSCRQKKKKFVLEKVDELEVSCICDKNFEKRKFL